jgi:hypothetical protein
MNGLTREKTPGGYAVHIVERLCRLGILELIFINNIIKMKRDGSGPFTDLTRLHLRRQQHRAIGVIIYES